MFLDEDAKRAAVLLDPANTFTSNKAARKAKLTMRKVILNYLTRKSGHI